VPGAGGGGRRRKPMRSPAARSRRLTAGVVQAQTRSVNAARSGGVGGGVSARVVALLTLAAFHQLRGPCNRDRGPMIATSLLFECAARVALGHFWSYTPLSCAGWLAERRLRVGVGGGLACGVQRRANGLATGFAMRVLRVMPCGESVMYQQLQSSGAGGARGQRVAQWLLASGLSQGPASDAGGDCSGVARLAGVFSYSVGTLWAVQW